MTLLPITTDVMETIAVYMDNEIRERVHNDIAPCEPQEFLKEYLKQDPGFVDVLKQEFSMYY